MPHAHPSPPRPTAKAHTSLSPTAASLRPHSWDPGSRVSVRQCSPPPRPRCAPWRGRRTPGTRAVGISPRAEGIGGYGLVPARLRSGVPATHGGGPSLLAFGGGPSPPCPDWDEDAPRGLCPGATGAWMDGGRHRSPRRGARSCEGRGEGQHPRTRRAARVCAHFPGRRAEAGPACGLGWPVHLQRRRFPSAGSFLPLLPDVGSFPRPGLVSSCVPAPARGTQAALRFMLSPSARPSSVVGGGSTTRTCGPCRGPTGLVAAPPLRPHPASQGPNPNSVLPQGSERLGVKPPSWAEPRAEAGRGALFPCSPQGKEATVYSWDRADPSGLWALGRWDRGYSCGAAPGSTCSAVQKLGGFVLRCERNPGQLAECPSPSLTSQQVMTSLQSTIQLEPESVLSGSAPDWPGALPQWGSGRKAGPLSASVPPGWLCRHRPRPSCPHRAGHMLSRGLGWRPGPGH